MLVQVHSSKSLCDFYAIDTTDLAYLATPYALPGTDAADGAVQSTPLSSYVLATQCTVRVTFCFVPMCGTGVAHCTAMAGADAAFCIARPTRYWEIPYRMPYRPHLHEYRCRIVL
eukprot:80501-Rhodomonas_salina.4